MASEKEERRREFSAGFDLHGALLDEAPEGRDAGAGADHDQGGVGDVEGKVERLMAVLDIYVDAIAFLQVREKVGCDAEKVFTLALKRLAVDDTPCESTMPRFSERGG